MKKTEKDNKDVSLFLNQEREIEKTTHLDRNNTYATNQPKPSPQFDSIKAFKKLDARIKKLS